MLEYLFYTLFFCLPLIFFPKTSEVFEFNKIVAVYIFTALIIAVWIVKMIQSKKIIFRRTILDIPLLLFLASQIISTIISIDTRTSIFGYYSRFNGGLLSTICYSLLYWAYVANMDKKSTKISIYSLLSSAFLVAIYGIMEHFGVSMSCALISGKFNDDCWIQDVKTRVFATLGQPNWLAAYLTALVPFTWYYALTQKQNKNKLIWSIISILFFACIIFTKSRSGLVALGAAYVIFWAFNFTASRRLDEFLKRFLIINILFLIIVAIFGSPLTPSINSLIHNQKQVQISDTSEGGTESGSIREIVWKGAINVWRAYPIFGTGVETFGYSYWQFRPIEHNNTSEWNYLYNKAHNEYLNFAANTGTIGLISYFILIGTSIFILRKNYPLLAGFISILITNFFGFSVVVISLLTFLFPAVAITLNIKSKTENEKINLDNSQKFFMIITSAVMFFAIFTIGKYWYADYLYQKGTLEFQTKTYESAVKNLQSAIDYSAKREPIYYNQMAKVLTQVATDLENANEASSAAKIASYAINESDLAFDLSPRNINIRQTRMGIYLQLSIFDPNYLQSAINLTKETIPLSPTDPKLYLILGKAYANTGKSRDAIASFKKALELKPDYLEAQKDLETIQKLQDKKK